MGRDLDSVQAERAGRSHIAPIPLVKLTLYSDRPTGAVAKTFYLSSMAVDYDYGNTGTDQRFLPVVIGGGDFFSGISHLGDPNNQVAFGQTFDLQCSNREINGSRFIELLQAYNLEGASIEIAEFQVDKIDSLPVDLTSYDGDEHYVLFPGRVNQIAPITDAMLTIQCTTELPSMAGSWKYVTGSIRTDDLDRGKRMPRVYGIAKKIPAINYRIAFSTVLTGGIGSQINFVLDVEDGSGFPTSGYFAVLIDAETMICAYATATTITVVDRPDNQGNHFVGEIASELVSSVYILSDHQSDAVNAIYLHNEFTNRKMIVDPSLYTGGIDLADNTAAVGRVVTSLTLTGAQVAALKTAFGIQDDGIGYALYFFADIDGVEAELTPTAFGDGENFDDGTWEVDGCTVAVDTDDKIEGTGSQKLAVPFGEASLTTDSTTGWSIVGSGWSLSVESDEGHTEGSGCLKATGTTNNSCLILFQNINPNIDIDAAGEFLSFDVKLTGDSAGELTVRLIDDAGTPVSAFWYLEDAEEILSNGEWYRIVLDKTLAEDDFGMDWTNIDEFTIDFTPQQTNGEICIDNIRIHRAAQTVAIQNNAIGDLDFSGPADRYQLAMKQVVAAGSTMVGARVFFSDDIGSGSTPTAEYREVTMHPTGVNGEWVALETESSADTGTIDDTVVRTLRVEFDFEDAFPPSFWMQREATESEHTVNVDDFKFATAVVGAWDAGDGDVMIHPADIIRHWIEVVGGETYDTTSYAALITALGASAKWGFDARSLGFTWEEVLQRMAFEARCNVFPVEKATGREWVMSSADDDYGFGAATATITQTHDMTDDGRAIADIANHLSFRYAFDASLESNNEEGFKQVLLASPVVSDVPIAVADILAASRRFGAIESGPIAFRCIQDDDTAEDVAGYYVQERMANNRRVFRLSGVAWFDALPYILGDLVLITAPWASAATNCRIISMTKAFAANTWTIVAVEVPVTGLHT